MNKEKKQTIEGSDQLSSLPDCVLIDILSRLEATEVVRTCILSKKWLKHWTFVPRLNFNYSEFKGTENGGRDVKSFENFVSMFLQLRDDATNLDSFTLCHSKHHTEAKICGSVAKRWILYTLKHNPKTLHIELCANDLIHLPDCLFTCESLEDVRLELGTENKDVKEEIKPDNVCLPRLRDFYIGNAYFGGDYMEKILFGCPALESLYLSECVLEMDSISFQKLKKLSINDCCFVGEVLPSPFHISAPGLECLYFNGQVGTGVKLEDMYTVTEATITTKYDDKRVGYNLELLSSLSGVETLNLDSYPFEETLEVELPRCPTFHNLKNLTLGKGCMYCCFGFLFSFLKHCPNLEVLTLFENESSCLGLSILEEHGHYFGSFGCKRLKKIDVRHRRYDFKVDQLVGLLLESTREMQLVQIILSKIPFDLA